MTGWSLAAWVLFVVLLVALGLAAFGVEFVLPWWRIRDNEKEDA